MTAAQESAVAGTDSGWQWLSRRSLIVRPAADLIRLVPVLAGVLFFGSSHGFGGYWTAAFAVLAILTSVVRWCTTRYRVTAERIYVRHGLISQKVLSVPRDRVRSVDFSAHLLYRLLGLRKVSVGTGRSDKRGGGGLHLDALRLADAEALRGQLMTGAGLSEGAAVAASVAALAPSSAATAPSAAGVAAPAAGVAASAAGVAAPEAELVRLRHGWVRFAPFTMTGLVIAGVVLGTAVQVVNDLHVNLATIAPVYHLAIRFDTVPVGQRILGAAAGVLVLLVLLSVAGYIALFWNFRLVRLGDVLRVSRGLLTTRTTTIDTRRLRGAELSEPLVLRLAGGARCLAITTGLRVGEGAEHGGSLLLPPAPRQVAHQVTAAVLATAGGSRGRQGTAQAAVPIVTSGVAGAGVSVVARADGFVSAGGVPGVDEVVGAVGVGVGVAGPGGVPGAGAVSGAGGVRDALITGELVRHGPAARRRRYVRALTGAVVLIGAAAVTWRAGVIPAWAFLATLVLLPLAAALAADRYRSLGHLLADGWLITRTGTLVRRRCILSTDGIIGWRIHQSWFQRRQGLVSLAATTAAGHQHYVAHDILAADAIALAAAATSPLMTPFLTSPRES